MSMIEVKQTPFSSTASLLSSAIATAEYFGFRPLEKIPKNELDKRTLTQEDISRIESSIVFARKEERGLGSVARKMVSLARPEHGVLQAWRITKSTGSSPSLNLELHIFGSSEVFAEAMLIVVTRAILQKVSVDAHTISINNMGTNESSGKFVRDVSTFLRKNMDSISPSLRSRALIDPIGTLEQLIEKEHPAINRAPQPLEYLNEDERRRLWVFLDFLETLSIGYEMDGQILGSRDCWAHTLFEISTTHPESGVVEPVAFGGRYDALASRYNRRSIGAVMVTIPIEVRGSTEVRVKQLSRPSLFYAYLGSDAQKKSLSVLDTLRRANIHADHELWHSTIGDQMRVAKHSAYPYLVIMGHKEALEDTVIVREVASNSQDTISSIDLVPYLKQKLIT